MLAHSEIGEYESQGFLVFDPQVDAATIDQAFAALRDMYLPEGAPPESNGPLASYRDDRRVQDAWKSVPAVKAIARAPRVMQLLESLYSRKPLPFQTLNFRMGSEQKTHSDTVHFNSRPACYMCGVWVALEDVDRENGPVMYFPGSHRWSEVALPDVDAFGERGWIRRLAARARGHRRDRDANADYAKYEQVIQHRTDVAGIAPAYAIIKKGQAFLWAANLLHGGSPQLDRSRTRASQVTHYFFEGCRYYTPLLQRRGKTAWRNPDWIV